MLHNFCLKENPVPSFSLEGDGMATTAMTNGKDGENGPIEIEALSLKEEAPKLVDDIPDGGSVGNRAEMSEQG